MFSKKLPDMLIAVLKCCKIPNYPLRIKQNVENAWAYLLVATRVPLAQFEIREKSGNTVAHVLIFGSGFYIDQRWASAILFGNQIYHHTA